MDFRITEGIVNGAQKVVFYGPEGIGKSTFASNFPDPLFIDTEGSTKKLNVKRLPKPTSWQMLIDEIKYIIQTKPCKTLVIDTADWAERLCTEAVCAQYGKKGVEDFGYGNGYTYIAEEWGRFLNLLQDVIDNADINVLLNCHAIIRKFEQPNEMGAYDRWELKLGKKTTGQTAPLTKEWADMVLFANYKTFSVAVDDKGKKHKAQGGQRVMYTTHHPCWDAKNRDGLPEELPLDYSTIAHLFENVEKKTTEEIKPTFIVNEPQKMKTVEPQPLETISIPNDVSKMSLSNELPKGLRDLMITNHVSEIEIMEVVSKRGYYPEGTPIKNYESGFIEGVLIGAWNQVFEQIKVNRKESNMQF